MKKPCRFIDFGYYNVNENMEKDKGLLSFAIENNVSPILRIYGWEPAGVTLGRNQKPDSINAHYCKENNIQVATRPTGGRAVYHQGDISYCFVTKADQLENGSSIRESYREISEPLVNAIKQSGVSGAYMSTSREAYTKSSACMAISTGADLEYDGKKLAGSAQFRKNGFILQHGSILINQDFDVAAKILGVSETDMHCINLSDITGKVIDGRDFSDLIKAAFEERFNLVCET